MPHTLYDASGAQMVRAGRRMIVNLVF
jgi:hypothetical protein